MCAGRFKLPTCRHDLVSTQYESIKTRPNLANLSHLHLLFCSTEFQNLVCKVELEMQGQANKLPLKHDHQ